MYKTFTRCGSVFRSMALIAVVLPGCSRTTKGEPNTAAGAGGTLALSAGTTGDAGSRDAGGDGGRGTGQSGSSGENGSATGGSAMAEGGKAGAAGRGSGGSGQGGKASGGAGTDSAAGSGASGSGSGSAGGSGGGENSAPPGYALVFEDDFTSGSAPDPEVYFYHFTWGDESNPENDPAFVQGATDTTGRGGYVNDAQTISDGLLKLTAVKGNARYGGQDFPYRTGMVRLKKTFLYGYFEVSAKMPPGVGLLPQFWLMPEEYDDTALWEIDAFEAPSTTSSTIYMNVHWGSGYGGPNHHQNMTSYAGNFAERFRTFAVEWLSDRIVWYVDGVEVKRHTRDNGEIPPVPMQVICNLDVGGTWPGSPDQSTPFPAVLAIDYLRIYQKP